MAEAKYITQRDGELINPRLINLNAITTLADYIVSEDKSAIDCNEIITILEIANHGRNLQNPIKRFELVARTANLGLRI